MIFDFLTG